jgi:hypothetical protein
MDASGQTLDYVCGLDDSRDARIAKSLTRDEARRIAAANFARQDKLNCGWAKLRSVKLRRYRYSTPLL